MTAETGELCLIQQPAQHPALEVMLKQPFSSTLEAAAAFEFLEERGLGLRDLGESTVFSADLPLAVNSHAAEAIGVLLSRRTVTAVYKSTYHGVIGEVMRPVPQWGISVGQDGRMCYWDENRHGGTPELFALGATEYDDLDVPESWPPPAMDVTRKSWPLNLMHDILNRAIYLKGFPEAWPELGRSSIPPPQS